MDVISNMNRTIPLALIFIATLTGCGGSSKQVGDVAGIIYDTAGNPVRGARVWVTNNGGKETVSSTSGSYTLTGVEASQIQVQAEVTVGSTRYYGVNLTDVYQDERARNVNLRLIATSQLSELVGVIFDNSGRRVSGARIFAQPTDSSIYTSNVTISDNNGEYRLTGLQAGVSYRILSNAQGFGTDYDSQIFTAGSTRTINFTLGNPTNPSLTPPANVSASVFTAPGEASRDRMQTQAVDNIKALIDPKHKHKTVSRSITPDNDISVEVYWDPVTSTDILGFGVSRYINSSDWVALDFVRDPYAELFVDSDVNLVPNNTYGYSVRTLSTSYNGSGTGESGFSNVSSVVPLGKLSVGVISGPSPTINWYAVPGATSYAIYIFDRYPTLGVSAIFQNYDNRVIGTSFNYGGVPVLQSGRTYYLMVLGVNSDASAKTISRVETFVAP